MKNDHCFTTKLGTITLIGIFLCSYVTAISQIIDRGVTNLGRRVVDNGPLDEMTDEQVREIQARINENVEKLRSEGRLNLTAGEPVRFSWPVKKASGQREFNIGFVGAFVDHNPAFPNQVLDWNCGMRTYDQAGGYNHRGTDINSQPFVWKRMYQNEQYAVAAAPGVIVFKQDGNFDQNCAITEPTGMWNAVYLMHSDGSITWYGHLKSGSLTRKAIGETVSTGEYLGVTGSSGSSRFPHLHFEAYNAANQPQDPYAGTCNMMNNFSWWVEQEPYRNSQILALYTGSAPPEFPECPQEEITNEKIVFQPLDTLRTTTVYRDQLSGQQTEYSLLRPDDSVFASWVHISPQTFDVARYLGQIWQLPADAPSGIWTFRAVYNGQTYENHFYVGQPPNVSASGRITTLNGTGISGAVISMTDSATGSKLTARSNPFGYYRIGDVVVGTSYSVNVSAKGRTFLSRSIMPGEELTNFDFFSLE